MKNYLLYGGALMGYHYGIYNGAIFDSYPYLQFPSFLVITIFIIYSHLKDENRNIKS
jgi:hypothetical protein